MKYSIEITPSVEKWFDKFNRANPKQAKKIVKFIEENLATSENPCFLSNAKKLSGFSDNRYRWRLGNYRIIGIVKNDEFKLIQIIKIAHRQEAYD